MAKLPIVVLAAGKGTRLLPLTSTTPKPLIQIQGKAILEHTLESAKDHISSIILVTGYLSEQYEQKFGSEWQGIPVTIVKQYEQKGTGDALAAAKNAIQNEWFYCIYGDDFYAQELFSELATVDGNGLIGYEKEDWQRYGVLKANAEGILEQFVEKPEEFISKTVNPGVYKLNKAIFDTISSVQPSTRNEIEIPDMVTELNKTMPFRVVVTTNTWIPVGFPWNLLDLAEYLLSRSTSKMEGLVENGAVIKGKVQLGEGSVIRSGTYIDGDVYIGKNCTVGPNAYIRKFASIGDNCNIGASVEIKGSVIGNNTKIPHLAYLPDSILGNDVNYAAGTITADLKHDGSNVKSTVNGELIDTGKRKFGSVLGDGAKTGINTTIYPGRKLWNGTSTKPGEIVTKDITN